jgi:hypothetical protein
MADLYSYGDPPYIQVTPGRLVVGSNTHSLANVSSVRRVVEPPPKKMVMFFGLLFLPGLGMSVLALIPGTSLNQNPDGPVGPFCSGILSFAIGLAILRWARRMRDHHRIMLVTNAGTVQALVTQEKEIADGVTDAINTVLDGGGTKASDATSASAPATRFCSACGAAVSSGAKFCANCGAAVGAAS